MKVLVTLVSVATNPNKRADATLILDGSLKGFQLEGFQVWIGRDDPNAFNVTFPARTFKRPEGGIGYYCILRSIDGTDTGESLKQEVLAAFHAESGLPAKKQRKPKPPSPRAVYAGKGGRPKKAVAAPVPVAASDPTAPRLVRRARSVAEAPIAAPAIPASVTDSLAAAKAALAAYEALVAGQGGAPEAPAAPVAVTSPSGRTAAQTAAWAKKPAWQKKKIWSGKKKGGAR